MSAAARRSIFWSGLEAGVSGLLSFLSACIVARLVGPSELGLGAALVATHVLLWVGVNGLFADALVQRVTIELDMLSSAFWASTAVGMAALLLQIAAGWGLGAWLGDSRLLPMSLFGCDNPDPPPAPVAAKVYDRMHLAPANPVAAPAPATTARAAATATPIKLDNSAQCAAARVSGGPLPPGCEDSVVPVAKSFRPASSSSSSWVPASDQFH